MFSVIASLANKPRLSKQNNSVGKIIGIEEEEPVLFK